MKRCEAQRSLQHACGVSARAAARVTPRGARAQEGLALTWRARRMYRHAAVLLRARSLPHWTLEPLTELVTIRSRAR